MNNNSSGLTQQADPNKHRNNKMTLTLEELKDLWDAAESFGWNKCLHGDEPGKPDFPTYLKRKGIMAGIYLSQENMQADPRDVEEVLKKVIEEKNEVMVDLQQQLSESEERITRFKRKITAWIILYLALLIGIQETLYFLHVYGWHWYPICGWEQFWDNMSVGLTAIGLYIYYKSINWKE